MPRNYLKKKPMLAYTVHDVANAVIDVQNKNLTYKEAQEKHGVPISVIYNRIGGRKTSIEKLGQGRSNVFSVGVEKKIVKCLLQRSASGYQCDKEEMRILISEYVHNNNIKTPFTDGKPGEQWYRNFMKRNPELSLKKPELLQKCRKNARKPDIIYDFYHKLNTLVLKFDLDGTKANFVFNADESGFCSDPSRLRAIGGKGTPLCRLTGGAGRESTTVLACVSADGYTLPPLIIFKGAAVQARWTNSEAFPGTLYGASKNGWMEEPQFFHWFENGFINHVLKLRTICNLPDQAALLLYDGHSSHISVRIVEIAIKFNVQLLRFPSHLTDKLQPLDKAVFGPVKMAWEKKLVRHGKEMLGKGMFNLSKFQFTKLLGEVWETAMVPQNIISGFESTGVFPVNPSKFPETDFNQLELKLYKAGLSSLTNTESNQMDATTSFTEIAVGTDNNTSAISVGPTLQTADTSEQSLQPSTSKSHSELVDLFAIPSNPSSPAMMPKKVTPRLKQLQYGEILTSDQVLERLKEAERTREEKNKPKKIKIKQEKQKNVKKKMKKLLVSSSSESDAENIGAADEYEENENINGWFEPDEPELVDMIEINEITELAVGAFILVNFKGGKRNASLFKYVCRVEQVDTAEREFQVQGFLSLFATKKEFKEIQYDLSFINVSQIVAKLPVPTQILEDDGSIKFVFNNAVPVQEKN